MRVFVAVRMDEKTRSVLEKMRDIIIGKSFRGRYVYSEDLHLTVKFIGEIQKCKLEDIDRSLGEAAKKIDPFVIRIGGLGGFWKKDSLIPWAGIKEGERSLKELSCIVQDSLSETGIPRDDREFKPHITLGRDVKIDRYIWGEIQNNLEEMDMHMDIASLSLMQSLKEEGKPVYRELKKYILGKEGKNDQDT